MRLLPIRYAAEVAASVRFYEALGLSVQASSRPGRWTELAAAAGTLAIHAADPGNAEF